MVDKVKKTTKQTGRAIYIGYEIVWLAATVAGATKLVTLGDVKTSLGNVPVWQVVAGILYATVVWKLVELYKSKEA